MLRLLKKLCYRVICLLVSPQASLFFGEPIFWLLHMRRRKSGTNLTKMNRILVVRLDEIGDVVMTTPFLRELRRNKPNAWITLVVKPAVYDLIELCPYVNEVLTYDWNTKGYLWQVRQLRCHGRALKLCFKYLWKRRFDLAIIPRWDIDSYHATFLAYFSGAPWRVGYSENVNEDKLRINNNYDRLFTDVIDDNTLKHEVERNLDVIRHLGGEIRDNHLELWLSEDDEAFADKVLRDHGVRSWELIVGFGPSGGNSSLKQWPVKNFGDLGKWLKAEYKAHIVIVGGPDEEMFGEDIVRMAGTSVINMVGKTTLRQMGALLKRCNLYIGNDAGPLHVAAAMNIPLIALFGSSCPHRFSTWGDHQTVIWSGFDCSPCFRKYHANRCKYCIMDRPNCILSITVEQVKEELERKFQWPGLVRL